MTDKHFKELSFLQLLILAAFLAIGLSFLYLRASNTPVITNVLNREASTPEGAVQDVEGLQTELNGIDLQANIDSELQGTDTDINQLQNEVR